MFFSVYTLGCKLNQLETEAISDSFQREGFHLFPWEFAEPDSAEAGLLVINTCTVTSMAEQKARRVIRKALREHPLACLIVTGCYAQMDEAALASLEGKPGGRFFVIPEEKKDSILDLPRFLANAGPEVMAALPGLVASWLEQNSREKAIEDRTFRFAPESFSSHSRGFLKIQDGCDRCCAYCRVNLARGKSRSLDADEVLRRLLALERKGFTEAVLTGVNISQYRDSGIALPGLLDFLLKGTEKIRLRLSSIEPDELSDDFYSVMTNKRIRPHFHLSMQSGSEEILAKMGRLYSPIDVEKAAARLRSIREDPFLACDIIAGFPGETAGDFEKTFTLAEKIGFSWIHAFPYSPRPGTPAFDFPGKVSEKERLERVKLLTALARKGRREYIQRWLGKDVEAVVEAEEYCLENGSADKTFVSGVSENYLKLLVNYHADYGETTIPVPGSLVQCRILRNQALLNPVQKAGCSDFSCFDAFAQKTG